MSRGSASNAARGIVRALLIAAICLTVFVGYGLIDNAWYRVLAVRGGSMQPTINAGDLIVITRPPDQVEEGMILTLQVDGAVVTHRVVAVRHDGKFVTQGDANERRDDFTANEVRIVGIHRLTIPWLGNLVDLFVGSGAWVSEVGEVGVEATTGTWIGSAEAIGVDPDRHQIVWAIPEVTPAPTVSSTADPTADAVAARSPSQAASSIRPAATVEPSATTEPTATAEPAVTAEPTASPATQGASPSATPEPLPEESPSPTPGPTP